MTDLEKLLGLANDAVVTADRLGHEPLEETKREIGRVEGLIHSWRSPRIVKHFEDGAAFEGQALASATSRLCEALVHTVFSRGETIHFEKQIVAAIANLVRVELEAVKNREAVSS